MAVSHPSWGKTYEEIFTPKANQAYSEDINIWVYTEAFAKRFAMPEQWIDNDLKGAYAVAFRVETSSERLMFPHKGPEVAMPSRSCILDAYIPADANVPWVDDRISDKWWYTPDSPTYLPPQNKEDKDWRMRPRGMPYWGKGGVMFGTQEESLGGLTIKYYDKRIYPRITYLSFDKGCVTPPKTASWIEFVDYEPRGSGFVPWEYRAKEVTHRIDIPEAFMKRLYDYWYEASRKPATQEYRGLVK